MRLIGLPTTSDTQHDLLPFDLYGLDIHASTDELRDLAKFLTQAVHYLDKAINNGDDMCVGLVFSGQCGPTASNVTINVVRVQEEN